jgi:hypothetical protein
MDAIAHRPVDAISSPSTP